MAKRDGRSLAAGPHRLQTLIAVILLGFIVLTIRLFTMQVVKHEEYAQFARDNQLQRERIPGPRGFMRDRSGRIIVDNALHFEVVMQWRSRNDVVTALRGLSTFIPVDTTRALARFDAWQKRYGRVEFPLFPDADKFVISFIRENWSQFPSLRVQSRMRRSYPPGGIAAHVFGYVGEVTPDDVAASPEGRYVPGDFLGKAGLERQYEEMLRGTPGQRAMEVTASGTSLGEVPELSIAPVPGKDLNLAMDYHMQAFLDSVLSLRPNPSAAVVLDVKTGGIIAATSHPAYDPNEFAMGVSPSLLGDLLNDQTKPMFNRISHARYPPASTFKMIVTYAVLTNRIVDPSRVLVYCTGSHRFGNRVFRCWEEKGHGGMNLTSAVVHSCDVYFYRVAEMMDVDVLASAAAAFGFDRKSGIDLPIEVAGNVPSRRYYDKRHGKGRWTQGLMLNNTIGQGEYLGTVLHVARMSAAIANGGWLVEPHFVDHAADEPPTEWPRTKIEDLAGGTLTFLQRAMLLVVEQPGGTAHWLRLPWLRFAAKTGTAQNPHGDDHSWFTAYAPADDPQIAVALIIENAGHGSEVAGPIVRDFLAEYFRADKPAPGKLTRSAPPPPRTLPAGADTAFAAGVMW
ncbi:MAG TPA: penicillin-binding protein 2 [Candidatus Krumholzibacteria bacterium]|nr:penicillin-binding protein 2 [Candidatus Krumholzibacteria bacterium]